MSLRADLNDLVRSPDGRLSEAKLFSVVFKIAMAWAFIKYTAVILATWDVLSVFIVAMIAPDVLKKWMVMRAGIPEEKK